MNGSLSDRATAGDLPLSQSQLVAESQYFFELSHGQPFRGQCGSSTFSGASLPALLSSVFRPWDPFRNDPDQNPDRRRKVIGLKSESVIGIIPES